MPPPTPPTGTALSDLLTTAKNLVTGIATLAQNYLNVQGAINAPAISTATLVKAAPGRVAVVSVTTASSWGAGYIYDSNSTLITSRPVYTIPPTVGVVFVNLPMSHGIYVVPGTGQVVTVSYS